jgi:hypothetical protein
MDAMGLTDAYIEVYALVGDSWQRRFKTEVVEHNLSPTFHAAGK